ncbi:hypothetical protein KI387_018254, partial [Taxus chinensis]
VACCFTGTDWGDTGAVSAGPGSGTTTSTDTAIGISTTAGIGAGTGTTTGTGCIGRVGATIIRSQGTSPTSHGGTGPLYG